MPIKIIFVILALTILNTTSAQDSLSYDQEAFANFLFDSDLFEFAAEEYERLHFYDPYQLNYLQKLLRCYGKLDASHEIGIRISQLQLPNKDLVVEYCHLLMRHERSMDALTLFLGHKSKFDEMEQSKMNYKLMVSSRQWDELLDIYTKKVPSTEFQSIHSQIQNRKRKSPGLAATLSAIIPGTGRFYSRDYKDGLISMVFIAGSAYQSYRRFKKQGIESVGGWFFGAVSLGYYIGNIYGSYRSAKSFNKKNEDRIYNNIMPELLSIGI